MRERDRQTDKTDGQTDRGRQTEIIRQREREIIRQTERERRAERQTDRQKKNLVTIL